MEVLREYIETDACLVGNRAVLLMVLYKTKFNWVTWSPPKYVLPIMFS